MPIAQHKKKHTCTNKQRSAQTDLLKDIPPHLDNPTCICGIEISTLLNGIFTDIVQNDSPVLVLRKLISNICSSDVSCM